MSSIDEFLAQFETPEETPIEPQLTPELLQLQEQGWFTCDEHECYMQSQDTPPPVREVLGHFRGAELVSCRSGHVHLRKRAPAGWLAGGRIRLYVLVYSRQLLIA